MLCDEFYHKTQCYHCTTGHWRLNQRQGCFFFFFWEDCLAYGVVRAVEDQKKGTGIGV